MITLNFKNQSGILLLFLSSLCSYNCSNDASLATADETTSDKLSNEEKFFLSRLNTNNHITPVQAEQIIRDETTGITTRGMSDLQIVGIIENKQEEGQEEQEKYQLDTLAYLFESKGQSKRYIVSADDRTHETLLAEYNYDGGENKNLDILYNIDCLIKSGISSYVRNEVADFETRKDSILASIYRKTGGNVGGYLRVTRGRIPKDDSLDEIVYVDEYIENWQRVGYKDPMLVSNVEGHAWNIDGYEKEKAVICRRAYRYDEATGTRILFSTSTFERYRTKFHYNWGWGGWFDGWFADGCFQPYSGDSNYNKSVKYLVATH